MDRNQIFQPLTEYFWHYVVYAFQTVSFLESCVILFKRTHYISIAQYFRKWMCFDIKSRYFFALFTLQLFSLFIKLLVCRMENSAPGKLKHWIFSLLFRCFPSSTTSSLSPLCWMLYRITSYTIWGFEPQYKILSHTDVDISQPIIIFLRVENLSNLIDQKAWFIQFVASEHLWISWYFVTFCHVHHHVSDSLLLKFKTNIEW